MVTHRESAGSWADAQQRMWLRSGKGSEVEEQFRREREKILSEREKLVQELED